MSHRESSHDARSLMSNNPQNTDLDISAAIIASGSQKIKGCESSVPAIRRRVSSGQNRNQCQIFARLEDLRKFESPPNKNDLPDYLKLGTERMLTLGASFICVRLLWMNLVIQQI